MCSGIGRRQALDAQLAGDLLHDAALLGPRRLADELHVDGRLDGAVEAHLVEVDVRDGATDRVALVVLEDGVMRGRLPLDHDVDDPMEPGRSRERHAKGALADEDRPRVALPVEDAGHHPLLAKATDAAGSRPGRPPARRPRA